MRQISALIISASLLASSPVLAADPEADSYAAGACETFVRARAAYDAKQIGIGQLADSVRTAYAMGMQSRSTRLRALLADDTSRPPRGQRFAAYCAELGPR